ncbi:hypothetical protein WG947_06030 [Pontibacter sp. H259]|uniref:hypothetical protein n=1 Tax=Pontibacter sp. H259 TaxID=3133421 RepID=UPI0030BC107C
MTTRERPQMQKWTTLKVLLTAIVAVLMLCFLSWEHFNGGVTSHHLLQQKSLPAISNWWSGIFLPALTWLLLSRTQKRLNRQASQGQPILKLQRQVILLWFLGMVLGALIATTFENGFSPFLDNVPYIILVLSLLIPIYYAEFMLGFILAMTYTFGAILPTAFILVLAAIGFLSYRFIRTGIILLTTKLVKSRA